jgi:hypothetical protein
MVTYSQYLSECNSSEEFMSWGGSKRKNKDPRPLKEKRFNRIRDKIQGEIEIGQYQTREEAEAALEIKVQQMGFIELLIFRAVIGWIVHKLLDAWFKR